MAYRATSHSTTGYSPFYLLHDREMVLPNEGDLKAKISHNIQDVDQVKRLEKLNLVWRKHIRKLGSIIRRHTRRTKLIMTRKLRSGNLKLTIRYTCFALLGRQAGVTSLDSSGKDPSLLYRNCLI
jgi:hypothetical protein